MSEEDYALSDLGRNPAQVTLTEATETEIFDELKRRRSCGYFALLRPDPEDEDGELMRYGWWGRWTTVVGLSLRMKWVIEQADARNEDSADEG